MNLDPAAVLSGRGDLDAVLHHLDEAADALTGGGGDGHAQACQRLVVVEDLLGAWLTASGIATTTARTLIAVRDELSVHLSVAATLTSLDLDGRVTTVLRRAVTTTQAGLGALRDAEAHGGG